MFPFCNNDCDHTARLYYSSHTTLTNLHQAAWQYVEAQYDVLETIGEGSYGKVVKAVHRDTGEIRAIKFIEQALYNAYEAEKFVEKYKF